MIFELTYNFRVHFAITENGFDINMQCLNDRSTVKEKELIEIIC